MDQSDRIAGWLRERGHTVEPLEGTRGVSLEMLPACHHRELGSGTLSFVHSRTEGELGELLAFVNGLNLRAGVGRFSLDADRDFAMEAWLPEATDSATFASFYEGWLGTWDLVVTSPDADRFLR